MTQNTITAGDAVAPIAFAGGNDGTLVLQTGAAGAKVNALVFAADGTPTFLKVPINAAVQSMVRVNTANGYGSTNTMIKRYSTVVTNQGSDITYADSATLGASFTINTNGVYGMSIVSSSVGNATPGISLNSSQLTTAISSIAAADRLGFSTGVSATACSFSTTIYLTAGAVIRPHTEGSGSGVTAYEQFTIVRVA
jgi:hypothetical protein